MTGISSALRYLRDNGWTQVQIARETGRTTRAIRKLENGLCHPQAATQRDIIRLLPRQPVPPLPAQVRHYTISRFAMQNYLGKAYGWSHWPGWRRAAWTRLRRFYKRILEEQSAGRAVITYRTDPRYRPPALR